MAENLSPNNADASTYGRLAIQPSRDRLGQPTQPVGSGAMPWAGLGLAVTLLTAIPLPGRRQPPATPDRRSAAAAMLLAAVLAITAAALLTRALHLDGLADFADGLGSGRPAGDALAIMKRPTSARSAS
jgi:hypothetical protein